MDIRPEGLPVDAIVGKEAEMKAVMSLPVQFAALDSVAFGMADGEPAVDLVFVVACQCSRKGCDGLTKVRFSICFEEAEQLRGSLNAVLGDPAIMKQIREQCAAYKKEEKQ